jgi:GNAT superfamily N-acetyltransferase
MHSPTTKEDSDVDKAERRREPDAAFRSGVRVREMARSDLERVLELRSVVRWSADPRAFDLLRGLEGARWAVAEAPDGALAGMVGAVPLGEIGILCQLAVRDGFRKSGIGRKLSSWAVTYLRSRGARTVRLYSTREAEGLYRTLGFEPITPRTVYRLEEALRDVPGREQAGGRRVSTLLFGDLPELYGADRWSYGADRSALILATLKLHPGWGLVARDPSGRLEGYLVRSALGPDTRLGPFVASSPAVARSLLASALHASEGLPVEVTVPGPPAHPAHALLKDFGFAGRADRLRMELGESSSHAPGLVHYGTTPYLAT